MGARLDASDADANFNCAVHKKNGTLKYKEIGRCQMKEKPLGAERFLSVPSGLLSPNFH